MEHRQWEQTQTRKRDIERRSNVAKGAFGSTDVRYKKRGGASRGEEQDNLERGSKRRRLKKRKYELVREDWGSTPKPVEEEGKKSTPGSSSSREGEGEQNQPTTSQGSKDTAPMGEQDMGGSREGEILRAPSNTTVEEEGGGDIYSPIDTPIAGGARVVTQQLITQFVGCKAIEQSEQLMSRAGVKDNGRL